MDKLILSNGVELKPIPEVIDPRYMAGSDGRIYSGKKRTRAKADSIDGWIPIGGSWSKNGYHRSGLYMNGKVQHYLTHRLVCSAFHGPAPTDEHEVRHLDGTRSNNKPDNLCWGTRYENWADREAHGRGVKGELHPNARFSDFERKAIRWAVTQGIASQHHVARIVGASCTTIGDIVRGTEGPLDDGDPAAERERADRGEEVETCQDQ